MIRTSTENTKFIELDTWTTACRHLPTYAKLPIRSRIIFAVEGVISHKWRKQDADGDQWGPPFTPLGEVLTAQDGSNKKGIKMQDLIAPPGRAPHGNLARGLSKAI